MSTGNNSATDAVTTPESPTTAAPTTTSQEPTTAAPTTQAPDPTTTTAAPQPTTTSPTTPNPNTESSTRDRTTTTQPTTTRESASSQPTTLVETTVVTNPTDSGLTSTFVITRTTTPTSQSSGSGTSAATSSSSTTISSGGSSGGLSTGGKIAVAVVVPIAAVALIVVAGLFLWRKRRARKDAKEARKQEIDDYGYNPNSDPTIPPLPAGGAYEMKDENTSGYRGWGSTTLSGSVGNKASTTISGGGVTGATYSDMASPAYANASDTRSGEPLMSDGTASPEGEILGAMGPSANQTRGGDVHRGPSNASSHYSTAARSDDSGGIGVAYGGPDAYYQQYSQANPYTDNPYSMAPGARPGANPGPVEMAGQPVIRDNPHRRNTRIENPSPYAQQPGISQNF